MGQDGGCNGPSQTVMAQGQGRVPLSSGRIRFGPELDGMALIGLTRSVAIGDGLG